MQNEGEGKWSVSLSIPRNHHCYHHSFCSC